VTAVLTTTLRVVIALLFVSQVASAEVVRVDVRSRADFGTHERVIARVHYAVDPKLPVNQAIADLAFAPRNADGKVEFAGDLLLFLPRQTTSARGTVFLEVVNRGRDQSLGLMSDARQRDLAPENWNLGDRFLLEQGFTVAFLGWQFDVQPGDGLSLTVPTAPVSGVVRASAKTQRKKVRAAPPTPSQAMAIHCDRPNPPTEARPPLDQAKSVMHNAPAPMPTVTNGRAPDRAMNGRDQTL